MTSSKSHPCLDVARGLQGQEQPGLVSVPFPAFIHNSTPIATHTDVSVHVYSKISEVVNPEHDAWHSYHPKNSLLCFPDTFEDILFTTRLKCKLCWGGYTCAQRSVLRGHRPGVLPCGGLLPRGAAWRTMVVLLHLHLAGPLDYYLY